MRMQVILDSSFARLGSAPIWAGKKGEFRDWTIGDCEQSNPQAAQTLFVIYIRGSIALRFDPFKRMYENGSKIALNLTCSKGFK